MSTVTDEQDRPERTGEDAVDDAWLVGEVLGGRSEAFDTLARRYQRRVFAVAYRLLNNRDDAWDVAQEALLKAYRGLGGLEDRSRFGPWLMRIVTNLALNYRRARRTSAAVGLDDVVETADRCRAPDGALLTGSPCEDDSPIPGGSGREVRAAVADALSSLPDVQRFALVLSSIEHVPQKDIADMLQCSVELVKWHVFSARKTMRRLLGRFLDADPDER